MFECGPAAVAAARISRQQRRRAGESESLHYNRRRRRPPHCCLLLLLLLLLEMGAGTRTHPFSMPTVWVTQLSSLRASLLMAWLWFAMMGSGVRVAIQQHLKKGPTKAQKGAQTPHAKLLQNCALYRSLYSAGVLFTRDLWPFLGPLWGPFQCY